MGLLLGPVGGVVVGVSFRVGGSRSVQWRRDI